jgi:Protein of unknown function (DUF1569)
MSTLADADIRARCCDRIGRLKPDSARLWGRMTAHQMICHLDDSFRVGIGEKLASPASNPFTRTVVKWIALRSSLPWPHGVKTRPEVEQGVGGTAPSDWSRDCAHLRQTLNDFVNCRKFAAHPIFGPMSQSDWMIWGYRHVDHHLRQFGV